MCRSIRFSRHPGCKYPHLVCSSLEAFTVSLPRERFQEIKPMMVMHSMHGLFLTCTQKSCLYLHNVHSVNVYTMYRQSLIEPLAEIMKIPYLRGGPVSCSWCRIPIRSGPLPGSNCPPFNSYPLHSFPTPSARVTLFTTTTSTITVFFIWDIYLSKGWVQHMSTFVCVLVPGPEYGWWGYFGFIGRTSFYTLDTLTEIFKSIARLSICMTKVSHIHMNKSSGRQ